MGRRKKGRAVSGWLILDKPYEMGSTQAVSKIRWLFDAKKAGHAGTLDPLATGMLPIALGEATKTVPYVTDGEKRYIFTVKWGEQTNTDDREGEIVETSPIRPTREEIEAILPRFVGDVEQTPPAFSAIKIDGERAYAKARAGEDVEIPSRTISIYEMDLVDCVDEDHARFDVSCSKGTYVRALARDMAEALNTCGHVSELRRAEVFPFEEVQMVSLDALEALQGDHAALDEFLFDPLDAMDGFTQIPVSGDQAQRIASGNPCLIRGHTLYEEDVPLCAVHRGNLLAIGDYRKGQFHPKRVLVG